MYMPMSWQMYMRMCVHMYMHNNMRTQERGW